MTLDPVPVAPPGPHIDRLFVAVGSDAAPFDRLTSWVGAALPTIAIDSCLVQRGTAAPVEGVGSTDYLLEAELEREIAAATVVVCDASPELIRIAHRHGLKPIVVVRSAERSETVGTTSKLGERLALHGQAHLCSTEAEFVAMLAELAADPTKARLDRPIESAALESRAAVAERPRRRWFRTRRVDQVTMLYVGGVGRSGSTLLNDLLGQHDDVVAVGELVHLFQRGLVEDNLCGCGEQFRSCPFWTAVGDDVVGGWSTVTGVELLEQKAEVDRNRFAHALLFPWLFRSIRRPLQHWGSFYENLIRATANAADARVVVDSTKQVSTGLLLRQMRGVDLRLVHLVRDPRGVAYSWTKKKRKVEVVDTDALMNQYHPATMAWRWLSWNLVFAGFRLLRVPVLKVHYEDLIASPRETLTDILTFGGVTPGELAFLDGQTAHLAPTHSVAGNPSRFAKGAVTLAPDEEWRTSLEPSHRRLVTVITAPLLRWYGYLGGAR